MIRNFSQLYKRSLSNTPILHFSKKLGIGETSVVLEEKIKGIS